MDDIPFDTVLIHGIVRDSEGRKMSKSLGNGVDPIEVIDEYGADALRFTLVTGNAPGNDIRYYPERVESARNFANKIWNASRFVLMNLDKDLMDKYKDNKNYTIADKWILSRLNTVVKEVTENIEKFELGIASQKIYDFIWGGEFCDWYIELVKPVLYGEDEKSKGIAFNVLHKVLETSLQLLHPIMPFITEEIYTHLYTEYESIVISKWPEYDENLKDEKSEKDMEYIIEAIKSIRNVRTEMNVPPSRKAKLMIYLTENEAERSFKEGEVYFEKLASASEVSFLENKETSDKNVAVVTRGAEIFIPLLELVDIEKEMERLNKEKEKLEKEIDRVEKKLSNEKFVSKAPESVVNEEREKGEKYRAMLKSVLESLESLK